MLPKGIGNLKDLGGMVKNAMQLKGKMEELKESLGGERIEASAGGGMVTVVMTGKLEVVSVKIEPEVIDQSDPEVLETLVMAAVNEALRKTQDMVKEKMTELAGGIDIPGVTS